MFYKVFYKDQEYYFKANENALRGAVALIKDDIKVVSTDEERAEFKNVDFDKLLEMFSLPYTKESYLELLRSWNQAVAGSIWFDGISIFPCTFLDNSEEEEQKEREEQEQEKHCSDCSNCCGGCCSHDHEPQDTDPPSDSPDTDPNPQD